MALIIAFLADSVPVVISSQDERSTYPKTTKEKVHDNQLDKWFSLSLWSCSMNVFVHLWLVLFSEFVWYIYSRLVCGIFPKS